MLEVAIVDLRETANGGIIPRHSYTAEVFGICCMPYDKIMAILRELSGKKLAPAGNQEPDLRT